VEGWAVFVLKGLWGRQALWALWWFDSSIVFGSEGP